MCVYVDEASYYKECDSSITLGLISLSSYSDASCISYRLDCGSKPSYTEETYSTDTIKSIFNLPNEPLALYTFDEYTSYQVMRHLSKVSGIYGFYCKDTEEVYVGSGKFTLRRVRNHLQNIRSNAPLQRDITKYTLKQDFLLVIFEVLGDSHLVTDEELKAAEQLHIDSIPRERLYNILLKTHSSTGYKHSDEVKQHLRNLRTGYKLSEETKAKLSAMFTGKGNPFFGKQHTDSIKQLLSDSRKGALNPMHGKAKSPEFLAHQGSFGSGVNNPSSKKCYAINLDTNHVLEFYSYTDAGQHFNTNRLTIA